MTADQPVRLESDELALVCDPARGFVITAIEDRATGANALWQRRGFTPAVFQRFLGPSGLASTETFVDLFVGGWFEQFPTTGFPGRIEGSGGAETSLLHGEVMRLPWVVSDSSATMVDASVDTLRAPFRLRRRIEVGGATATIRETVTNLASVPAPYAWGQHPCFDRQVFAGGRFELDVAEAWVLDPPLDAANDGLAQGARFRFPEAPLRAGGVRDVGLVPRDPDGRHEQIGLRLRSGGLRITAPALGRALRIDWDAAVLPWVLVWQNYGARDASFWGTADVFAIEPSTIPGRGMDDGREGNAIRWLDAGATSELELRISWEAI